MALEQKKNKVGSRAVDHDALRIAYRVIVERVEKGLIEKALGITAGNQIVAAKVLGINRNTIRHKIRRFGIKVTRFKK